jgi:hypothetical protein
MIYTNVIVFSDKLVTSTEVKSSSNEPLKLDPEIRENLQQELEFNLDVIRKQYALFVSHIHDALVDIEVSVESLCTYLVRLPALEYDDGKDEHKLLYGISDQLEKADTVTKIFGVLHDYTSFLNYDVYQCILDRYSTELPNTDLDAFKYSEKLEAYLHKHKLSEFVELNRGLEKITDSSKKLILKFDIALPSKVTKVLHLKKAIAKVLRLKTPALRLVGIEEGCVLVTFLIPFYPASLSPEQIQELWTLSVLRFQCGDQVFDSIPGKRKTNDSSPLPSSLPPSPPPMSWLNF